MRITLITSGSSYPLAGQWPLSEREFAGAVDFKISAEHVAESVQRVRAANAKMFHRGNLATTVSFSTRRIFASHAEALIYAADLAEETPRTGEVMFATGAGARYLQDAVVRPPTHEVDGCAVRMDYVATGSSITRMLPPAVVSSTAGGGLVVSPGGGGTMPEELEDARLDGTLFRVVLDSDGEWAEFGIPSPTNALVGDAANGWTDPGGNVLLRVSRSTDLIAWDYELIDCPTGIEDMGEDVWVYWARAKVPSYWETTLRDFRIGGDNYGKSITEIYLYDNNISLSGYPYAMPADKARLQADLRAAGYTGATVTSASAALTAKAINYTIDGRKTLVVTQSGTNVTAVAPGGGGTISLPAYPYAMPSQRAALQSALRTAGYAGAVVTLFADSWEIFIPNRSISGKNHRFSLLFTPADPFKAWDFYGNYVGELPGNAILGGPENVRTPSGDPLQEAARQFFRLEVSAGPNNKY